jgi:glycerol-3-phosphate acyltransferase PlsY
VDAALGLLVLVAAYLLGAVPFGYWLVKAIRGIDIREHGSGNIGATNVMRIAGPGLGLPVFALDVAKGCIPVLAARAMVSEASLHPALPVACAAAAILGHMYSVFLRGKGGKGVATAAGALAALDWLAVICGLAGWTIVLLTLRYVSVASMSAAVIVMVASWGFSREPAGADLVKNVFVTALGAMVIWKHRENIKRLAAGTESRAFTKES